MFSDLNKQHLQNLSNAQIFQDGIKYYQQGRVREVQQIQHVYYAKVDGLHTYTLKLDKQNFDVSCDCHEYKGDYWCKHLVALGLILAHGKFQNTVRNRSAERTQFNVTTKTKLKKEQRYQKIYIDHDVPKLDQVLSEMDEEDKNRVLRHVLRKYHNIEQANQNKFIQRNEIKEFSKKLKKIVATIKRIKNAESHTKQILKIVDLFREQFKTAPQNLDALQIRLDCAVLVSEQLNYLGSAQDFIIHKLFEYLDVINVYLETQPKETISLLQDYLTLDTRLAKELLDLLIASTQDEAVTLIHNWLEQSNVRRLGIFYDSEEFQYQCLMIWASQGRYDFISFVEECDLVKNKNALYLKYYESIKDWRKYLEHSIFTQNLFDPIRAEALQQIGQYQQLNTELFTLLQDDYLLDNQDFIFLIKLSLDTIQHLALSMEEFDRYRQNIFDLIEKNPKMQKQDKISLYLDIFEFNKAKQMFIDFYIQYISQTQNDIYSDISEKRKYNYLLSRWMLIEHHEATDLIVRLFNLESENLLNYQHKNYDQLFKLLYELKKRQQFEVIDEFYDFAHTYLINKKVLLQRLQAEFLS